MHHGGGGGEGGRVGETAEDGGENGGVLLERLSGHRGQDGQNHDAAEENRGAAFALHEAVHRQGDQAGQQIVGNEEQEHGDQAEPEAAAAGAVEAQSKAQIQAEKEEPERVDNADQVASEATVGGGQGVAAQLYVAEHGVHTEAENVAGQHGFQEDRGEHGLGNLLTASAADGEDRGAEAAGSQQGNERHQQQIAGEEEGNAAIARTRLGPKQFVAKPDEFAD